MDKLEHYIVLLYSRTSDNESVNSARLSLFCQMLRPIDNIQPVRAALEEHTRQSIYQGGLIWGHCLEKCPDVVTASDWGWEVDGSKFKPKWTVLPIAEKACLELISCKCMKSCRGTVNVTERTLFALPCANVAARVMSSDLLNWNLLINLLDNWKSSP